MSADSRVPGSGAGGRNARRAWRLLPAACCLLLAGCEWFTDFKDQPRIEPWEEEYQGAGKPFRGNPQHSVSIDGATIAGYEISRPPFPLVFPVVIDSFAAIPNPHPATEASVQNGWKYYQINCAVCHGLAGKGDGPALRYGVAAPSLVSDRAKGLSDGYYFGIMRNGRASMPSYDRIEAADRWDVVNYIRGLQGSLGRTVPVAAAGTPGETGQKVPGASISAPTRPSPYYNPHSAGLREMNVRQDSAGAAAPAATPARDSAATAPDTARAATPAQGARP